MSTAYHSFELSNSLEPLSHINDSEILASPTVDNFHPRCHSSPRTTPKSIASASAPSPNPAISDASLSPMDYGLPLHNNMSTLIVNCNSIQGKSCEFKTVVHYIKPDIIIGTESKLGPYVLDSEVFPEGYVPYRKEYSWRSKTVTPHLELIPAPGKEIVSKCGFVYHSSHQRTCL